MDNLVYKTQVWLNDTYTGKPYYNPISEDGVTGNGTIKALITALQIEIGISAPNGTFGPGTTTACPTVAIDITNNANVVYILQGGLYCKGYNGGFNGIFTETTKSAVTLMEQHAGFTGTGRATVEFWKALMNMEAYVLRSNGDARIRSIQQDLNRKYSYLTGIIPTDGVYSRTTNKALIYGLQKEIGIAAPNGTFGPATQAGCPSLNIGSTKTNFIYLMQYSLYVNGFSVNSFNGTYDSHTKSVVKEFQSFVCLPAVDGICGLQTWLSLLVSYGDNKRKGTACDCITTITAPRAKTLVYNGYNTVGRYLVNVPGGLNKKLQPGELNVIFNAGLKVVPIFQTSSNNKNYFTSAQGKADAKAASNAAFEYGFKPGTTIYFAVDYDAYDQDIDSNILPYFKSIGNEWNNSIYNIGVYGARNICSRVSTPYGSAIKSFICDMSSGFSGNLGFAHPQNWAFDQISTITLGSGDGNIQIDNNIASPRATGESSVNVQPNELLFNRLQHLYEKAAEYKKGTVRQNNELVFQFLRKDKYNGLKWAATAGSINQGYIDSLNIDFTPSDLIITMPDLQKQMDVFHLAATANAQIFDSRIFDFEVNDLAGWAGDLLQMASNIDKENRDFSYDDIYKLIGCTDSEAKSLGFESAGKTGFAWDDFYQDIDGYNIGFICTGTPIHEAFRHYYTSGYKHRYESFLNNLKTDYSNAGLYDLELLGSATRYMTGNSFGSQVFTSFMTTFDKDKWADDFARAFSTKINLLYISE